MIDLTQTEINFIVADLRDHVVIFSCKSCQRRAAIADKLAAWEELK